MNLSLAGLAGGTAGNMPPRIKGQGRESAFSRLRISVFSSKEQEYEKRYTAVAAR
jgi:hypothetical protein